MAAHPDGPIATHHTSECRASICRTSACRACRIPKFRVFGTHMYHPDGILISIHYAYEHTLLIRSGRATLECSGEPLWQPPQHFGPSS
ncbi:MAG: hypothetical protein HQ475_03860 [SAR202 cluster bacterium]|nr:hypothetical protein [SAR202 cluster bacterium]